MKIYMLMILVSTIAGLSYLYTHRDTTTGEA
jgi:hypothetical protein